MKKWSIITSLIVVSALAVAAFATTVSAAAAGNPYEPTTCPTGEEGVPPYCKPVTPPPNGGGGGGGQGGGGGGTTPTTCPAGQVGTPPNCVIPTLSIGGVKIKPNTSTLILKINAPGTVKVSGKGVKSKLVKVKPGNAKIKVLLTPAEKKLLKETGKVSLKVTIVYTPTGGSPIKKTVKITFKSPKSAPHKSKH
jgi:hypothetical protein